MKVYLNTPWEMTGARIGLSVWLYQIVREESTLNRPPRRIAADLLQPVPLPVKLHYLLTPVTNSTADDSLETEQVILGKTLQSFHVHPQLMGTDLRDDYEGTDAVITVRLETLSLEELSLVWDAQNIAYRTSLSYEITVVDVDPDVEPTIAAPVRIPLPEIGEIVGGPV